MPRRSKINLLKPEVKAWLDQELIKRGFSGYEELEVLLKQQGLKVGKSVIHRYGQKLQRQIDAIKASTEAAQIIAEATPDEADARSGAVISMFQTGIFDAMLAMQEGEELPPAAQVEILGKAAQGISQLTRASIAQKKWSAAVRSKLEAAKKSAADKAEAVARKAGLSDDDWGAIRAQILGIEVDA
ncbi:MAG: DUF3486 family protein [gamma proteobacterium endosymbiont of Lamellibrachia anaximandri]|nr:DUF3486 family protein [gamma proteobacterium endosymbiont of Lamellibrachia anaximandri]